MNIYIYIYLYIYIYQGRRQGPHGCSQQRHLHWPGPHPLRSKPKAPRDRFFSACLALRTANLRALVYGLPTNQFLRTLSLKGRQLTASLSAADLFQQTSARYRAVEPEQWLQRHPEAGSFWPSWRQASHTHLIQYPTNRCRSKTQQHGYFQGLLPESQGQNLAWTVLYLQCSLDIGNQQTFQPTNQPTNKPTTHPTNQPMRCVVTHSIRLDPPLSAPRVAFRILRELSPLQGYLAHKKLLPPRTLQ